MRNLQLANASIASHAITANMPIPKAGLRKINCPQCHQMIAICKDGSIYKHQCHSGGLIFCKGECGRNLPPDYFYRDLHKPRGYVVRCKDCYSLYQKTVTRNSPNRRESELKQGAKVRKLAYNLTREQFMSFWQKSCTYCGSSIETIGLDRVNNKVGYEMDNLVSCCSTCNHAKAKMDASEYIEHCKKVAKHCYSANASIACNGG
jgi:hypothetical protein